MLTNTIVTVKARQNGHERGYPFQEGNYAFVIHSNALTNLFKAIDQPFEQFAYPFKTN